MKLIPFCVRTDKNKNLIILSEVQIHTSLFRVLHFHHCMKFHKNQTIQVMSKYLVKISQNKHLLFTDNVNVKFTVFNSTDSPISII